MMVFFRSIDASALGMARGRRGTERGFARGLVTIKASLFARRSLVGAPSQTYGHGIYC